jgi:RES domain-containing protein
LALLETLVHTPYKFLKNKDYQLLEIFIPDTAIFVSTSLQELPKDWNDWSPQPLTRKFGDAFLKKNEALVMKVPSVLMPEEHNFIINPLHSQMRDVRIVSQRLLRFNDRLMQAMD